MMRRSLMAKLGELHADILKFAAAHEGIRVHVLKNEKEEEKYWTIRRESFALAP